MKQKKLLFSLIGVCLLLGFSSCSSEDKSVFGDDFEIPELTDANTIQFTVDASGEWKVIEMNAGVDELLSNGVMDDYKKSNIPIMLRFNTGISLQGVSR